MHPLIWRAPAQAEEFILPPAYAIPDNPPLEQYKTGISHKKYNVQKYFRLTI